ncbi:MAG: acyl--CoA ligase [Candidatus Omnitrophica bacterium]|nr:acyl--CoA ligase [Candidatus Omnitrophota bacterium]
MNIKELLVKQAENYPKKSAILFEDRTITYLQLKEASFRVANHLSVSVGEKIAVYLPNIPEAVFSLLGVFSKGACAVPVDFMLTESEMIHIINHSEAKILIVFPKKGIDLNSIKQKCPNLKEIVVCGQPDQELAEFTSWQQVCQASSDAPDVDIKEDSLSSIFYTSGSTGQPKGVMLNYSHLDNPVKNVNHFLEVTDQDVFMCAGVPFSHLGGLDYILFMLNFATTLVLTTRFNPFEFIKNIEKHKVSIFCIVPAMFIAILSLKDAARFNFSSLRYAVVFGAPSSPVLLKKFQELSPEAKLLNGWGMTETAAPNAFSPQDISKINSIGKFDFNTEAKLIDDEGNLVDQGELLIKGEGVMVGYYKNSVLTKETLTEDGWLKTGDIARRDQDGLYYIIGRIKEMIKVAGEIVFSFEVEEKIQRHTKVEETAVIGVFDKLRGEVPKAFIVIKKGESLEEVELKEFLKQHLAHFKIPHYFEFVSQLPKNRVGKIDKSELDHRP